MTGFFKYRPGVRTGPGVQNRAFVGDIASHPVWPLFGASAVMNKRQLVTNGALVEQPRAILQQVSPTSNYSAVTSPTIDNPFHNKSSIATTNSVNGGDPASDGM